MGLSTDLRLAADSRRVARVLGVMLGETMPLELFSIMLLGMFSEIRAEAAREERQRVAARLRRMADRMTRTKQRAGAPVAKLRSYARSLESRT